MFTLGDIPRLGALRYSAMEAIVFEGVRLTYRQLNERINRLSQSMSALGFHKGERVAILSDNTHKYIEVYFAVSKLGMSLIPLNVRLPDEDLIRILDDSEAALLIVGEGYAERADRLQVGRPWIKHRIMLDQHREGCLCYEDLLQAASSSEPQVPVAQDEMLVMAYKKNGTTALPKGVMLSHRNVMTTVLTTAGMLDLSSEDTGCCALPFYQTDVFDAFSIMATGGKVAINRKADTAEILRLIQNERCTHINLLPAMYDRLQRFPALDKYDVSSIRMMVYTGSPFSPDVLEQCVRKFWKRFAQEYGTTETSGRAVTFLNSDDHVLEGPRSKLLASAGKPSACAEVQVVDARDRQVRPRQVGEVVVKGSNVMMGYWKDPQLTEYTLRNGWLHTGDLGYMDAEGYLYVLGRKHQLQAA